MRDRKRPDPPALPLAKTWHSRSTCRLRPDRRKQRADRARRIGPTHWGSPWAPISSELSHRRNVCSGVTDFAIDPPIRILGRRGTFVRSTEQAAAFMREHMLKNIDGDATEVLRRLEDVRSAQEAQDAAQAFRTWMATLPHGLLN